MTKATKSACIYSEKDIVYEVSDEFLQLTGYTYDDIIDKTLREFSLLLKSNFQRNLEDIKDSSDLYIFTSEDLPLNVKVTYESLSEENKKVYFFEKNINSTLDSILLDFDNIDMDDKEILSIYSYPDCIHLKSNKKSVHDLSSIGIKFDNPIGGFSKYSDYLINSIKERNSVRKREVEFKDLNGLITYWDINIRVVFEDLNKGYFICFFYDVTKEVEERLFFEKQRIEMKMTLDNISDTIIKVDNKGKCTYLNKAAVQEFKHHNFKIEDINNEETFRLWEYNDINGNKILFENSPVQRVLRGEKINNSIIIGTSNLPNTYYECSGIPIYSKSGNIDGGVIILKNIEDKFKMEEYVAFKENIKEVALMYASLSWDNFKIEYINESNFNSIKTFNPHINSLFQVIGKSFFDFYNLNAVKDKNLIKNIKKSIQEKTSYIHKQKFTETEETKYIKTIFQPIFDEKGKVEKVIAVGIDITEEEVAKKQMAKELTIQEETFVNTSHELKTPLNLIFSASQLLDIYFEKDSLDLIKEDIKYTNSIIIKNCYRLTKLINNILDISKVESGFSKLNLSNNNLVDIIDDIVHSVSNYTKSKSLKIVFDTDFEEMIIALDVYKFERVLLNLISNAIKFSNVNGEIFIRLTHNDDKVEISVSDNGIGIDKEYLDMIFNKFVQVNTSLNRISEGTGIGLALVKSIVELHGGRISVESTLGKGSIFTIELPAITVNGGNINENEHSHNNKDEMIKFEFSDIYS